MRILFVITAVVVAAFLTSPFIAASEADVPKGKVYAYKQVDGVNREMEIYFPKGHDASKKTVPGIILFHGGGWGGGSRVAFGYQCDYFASRGMVAATVTYRLRTKEDQAALTEGQSTKRVCIPDVKSAIRWFKQNAKELGVDPNRIVAGGGSAGGHISLIGTTQTMPLAIYAALETDVRIAVALSLCLAGAGLGLLLLLRLVSARSRRAS